MGNIEKVPRGFVALEFVLFVMLVWSSIFYFLVWEIQKLRGDNRRLMQERLRYDGMVLWKSLKRY